MNIKRKYADKSAWKRVLKKSYKSTYVESVDFNGYLSIVLVEKVSEPLIKKVYDETICIVNDGYIWLEQYYVDKNYSISTVFDENRNIVQWYIDIAKKADISTDGIPYIDDLFLDLVMTPTSDIEILDQDELEQALEERVITKEEYDMVIQVANDVKENVLSDKEKLIKSSNKYLSYILDLADKS
jgi:predicted RNA-binding protein associated with RNAse of E/G family